MGSMNLHISYKTMRRCWVGRSLAAALQLAVSIMFRINQLILTCCTGHMTYRAMEVVSVTSRNSCFSPV